MADWFETRFREAVDAGQLDPAFVARMRALVVEEWQADAGTIPSAGTDPDDREGDVTMVEIEDRLTGHEQVTPGRRSPGRWLLVAAAVAVVVAVVGTLLFATRGDDGDYHVVPATPTGPVTNGWIALDGDGDIYLVRPGQAAHRLEVAGSDAADDSCPTWSPDGTRLSFGRVTGSSDTASSDAELVIVPVGRDGATGAPNVIALDGFHALPGVDPHPCATWAPDGRWVAFTGNGDVWVVDTHIGAIRRLPDLRPTDLEWRPGTDELAIAGDTETSSTPVTIYSVATGELRTLGSVRAATLTWSPDGSRLAYRGGENYPDEIRVADADGTDDRVLGHDGWPLHGVGPVWSPTAERIAFQRRLGTAERTEVVLVNVADGNEKVIGPPQTDGPNGSESWYPRSVTWSPDGTTLLYSAWSRLGGGCCGGTNGVLAVRADTPTNVTVLTDRSSLTGFVQEHPWVAAQMWGRQPG